MVICLKNFKSMGVSLYSPTGFQLVFSVISELCKLSCMKDALLHHHHQEIYRTFSCTLNCICSGKNSLLSKTPNQKAIIIIIKLEGKMPDPKSESRWYSRFILLDDISLHGFQYNHIIKNYQKF